MLEEGLLHPGSPEPAGAVYWSPGLAKVTGSKSINGMLFLGLTERKRRR